MTLQQSLRPVIATLLLVACAAPAPMPPSASSTSGSISSEQQSDWAQILRVEQQAKALIHTEGCANAGQCRTAAVGAKACGGPRYYLTYCAATTDTASLTRLLDRIRSMENAYNKKWQIVSTCEYRQAPDIRFSSGFCQEIGTSR